MRVVQPHRSYDDSFKADAVALLERSGRSLSSVAQSLGVSYSTLRYWYNGGMAKKGKKPSRQAAKVPVVDPLKETTEQKLARLERENAALRKRNEELEMDRAILKKAAAFFAKESE
jgi:transposase